MPAASSPTTTTARPAAGSPPESPPPARQAPPVDPGGGLYRMSLETYHRIAELEILRSKDRVVLLDGILVKKMTQGPRHTTTTHKAQRTLDAIVPRGWYVRREDPITLPEGPAGHPSEPEPDLAIVTGELGTYLERHPLPREVALVVEVAESSLRLDRDMLARYAWAGIPMTWIVNLKNRTVEVYTDPTGPGEDPRYRTSRTLGEDGQLPLVLDGLERGAIPVRDLLP